MQIKSTKPKPNSTISLLLLLYYSRFLTVVTHICNLNSKYMEPLSKQIWEQLKYFHLRIKIIRNIKVIGVLSLLLCFTFLQPRTARGQIGGQETVDGSVSVAIWDNPQMAKMTLLQISSAKQFPQPGMKPTEIQGQPAIEITSKPEKPGINMVIGGRLTVMINGRKVNIGVLRDVGEALQLTAVADETQPGESIIRERGEALRHEIDRWTDLAREQLSGLDAAKRGLTSDDLDRLALALARMRGILWILRVDPEVGINLLGYPKNDDGSPAPAYYSGTTGRAEFAIDANIYIKALDDYASQNPKPLKLKFFDPDNRYEGYSEDGQGDQAIRYAVFAMMRNMVHELWHYFQDDRGQKSVAVEGEYWTDPKEREAYYIAELLVQLLYEEGESTERTATHCQRAFFDEPVIRDYKWAVAVPDTDPRFGDVQGETYPVPMDWDGVAIEDMEAKVLAILEPELPRLTKMWSGRTGSMPPHLLHLRNALSDIKKNLEAAQEPPHLVLNQKDFNWQQMAAMLPDSASGLKRNNVGGNDIKGMVVARGVYSRSQVSAALAGDGPVIPNPQQFGDTSTIEREHHPWAGFAPESFIRFKTTSSNIGGGTVSGYRTETLKSVDKDRIIRLVRLEGIVEGTASEYEEWETFPRTIKEESVTVENFDFFCSVRQWTVARQNRESERTIWVTDDGRILRVNDRLGPASVQLEPIALDEVISVAGHDIHCTKLTGIQMRNGVRTTRTSWLSPEVPGYLVKFVSEHPGGKTEMVLVEYGTP